MDSSLAREDSRRQNTFHTEATRQERRENRTGEERPLESLKGGGGANKKTLNLEAYVGTVQ
jgi:hypothetical protein